MKKPFKRPIYILILSGLFSGSVSAQTSANEGSGFGCAGFNEAQRAAPSYQGLSAKEYDSFMIGVIMGMARVPENAMKEQDKEAALKHIHDFCSANPDKSAIEGAREFLRGWKRS